MSEEKQGFKQTEAGVVPEDWNHSMIGDIAGVEIGRDLRENSYSKTSTDIFKYPVYSNTVDNYGLYGFYDFKEYRGESVTVIGRGVGLGTAFIRDDAFGAIGRLLVLNPNEKVDYRYLGYYLNGKLKLFKESGGIPQLTGVQIKKYYIAFPPTLEEQQAIASALSDVDELIRSLDRLIQKKEAIKKGTMQQLLTGKKRLPGFDGEWQIYELNQLINRIPSKPYQISSDQYKRHGKYPVIDQGKKKIAGFFNNPRFVFKTPGSGVVIFGDHTRILKFTNKDFVIGADGVQLMAPKDLAHGEFLYYYLKKCDIPNTGYNRHFKFLREIEYKIPENTEEQKAIAQILSDMDRELQTLRQKREKYKQVKQGMMQELLTGKTRLV